MSGMELDPLIVIAVPFMLFNGGVLGFMLKSLSRDIQVSAMDGRIATPLWVMGSECVSRQWARAAAADYLTKLPNRRTITATGEGRFNSGRRRNACFALAVRVIDHFKSRNGRLGHEAGGLALKHVAVVLNQYWRGPSLLSCMANRCRSLHCCAWR